MATKKSKKSTKKKYYIDEHEYPIRWLPIDSRFITPFFRFGSVTGISRIFLEVEITLAIIVVIGTLFVAALKLVSLISAFI